MNIIVSYIYVTTDSNFSATLLKPNRIITFGGVQILLKLQGDQKYYGPMGVQIFQEGVKIFQLLIEISFPTGPNISKYKDT